MSIQFILNNCLNFDINYRRIVNQMVSRAGALYATEYPTAQPFKINITMHNYLFYPEVRPVIQSLDNLDKNVEEIITFNGVGTDLLQFTAYQGDLTFAQIEALIVLSYSGNTLVLGGLPSGVPGAYVVRAGDFIQPVGHRYPYKVRSDVLVGTGASVNVPVHRPIIGNVPGGVGVTLGSAVTLPVVALAMPAYQINPMSFVEWEADFSLIENILV